MRSVELVEYRTTPSVALSAAELTALRARVRTLGVEPGGLLIYAAGETEPGVHQVRHVGKRLEVVSLNLGGSPREVLEQVASVASRIREMAA